MATAENSGLREEWISCLVLLDSSLLCLSVLVLLFQLPGYQDLGGTCIETEILACTVISSLFGAAGQVMEPTVGQENQW